jgi:hypothetical protein
MIVPERVHLQQFDHSPKFWAKVEVLMPDDKRRWNWLPGERAAAEDLRLRYQIQGGSVPEFEDSSGIHPLRFAIVLYYLFRHYRKRPRPRRGQGWRKGAIISSGMDRL